MLKNCLTYALYKFFTEGGRILIRRSYFSRDFNLSKWNILYWVPHFLHKTKKGYITEYVPTDAQKEKFEKYGFWYILLTLIHIDGYVRKVEHVSRDS